MKKDVQPPEISTKDYEEFGDFLRSVCGINLGDNKQYLVTTRTRRILMQHGITSLSQLVRRIRRESETVLRQQVVDAMTTNETFWFRDSYPFEFLANEFLPDFARNQTRSRLRIWSAACSSGQEPYSISIVLEEFLRRRSSRPIDAEILATDVSSAILQAAQSGRYDRLSLARGLSQERMRQYFVEDGTGTWTVVDPIKKRVRYRALNLQESFTMLGRFDLIFCRNVLIYFSSALKREILIKIRAQMERGGLLFLGSSESVVDLGHLFEMVHCNPGVAYRAI